MFETSDLLPAEVVSWQLEQLRLFRLSGGHGFLRLNIQDGRIVTYGEYRGRKRGQTTRHTTDSKPS